MEDRYYPMSQLNPLEVRFRKTSVHRYIQWLERCWHHFRHYDRFLPSSQCLGSGFLPSSPLGSGFLPSSLPSSPLGSGFLPSSLPSSQCLDSGFLPSSPLGSGFLPYALPSSQCLGSGFLPSSPLGSGFHGHFYSSFPFSSRLPNHNNHNHPKTPFANKSRNRNRNRNPYPVPYNSFPSRNRRFLMMNPSYL